MAASLSGSVSFASNGMQYLAGDIGGNQSQLVFGSSSFLATAISVAYGTGVALSSGAHQVNDWYLGQLTIADTATYSFCFSGGSDANPFGTTLAFTKAKLIIVSLNTQEYVSNVVKIGPQGVSNAAQLWYGGTGATVYTNLYGTLIMAAPATGWTVNSTTASLFPIVNGSGASQIVNLFVAGVK